MAEVEAAVERKNVEIRFSEERIEYMKRRMVEEPRLARLYEYWLNYYIVRRATWLTLLWLEELRDNIKPEVREGISQDRARDIEDYLSYLEKERTNLLLQLVETRRLAITRMWRIRFPIGVRTIERWISRIYGRMSGIAFWKKEIERELPPPRNKLVALHKRWSYKSPRGNYHNISIEAVASIIISPEEKKKDHEDELREAMEDHLFSQEGFERLTELSEEVLGFEERSTDMPLRGVKVETLEYWHKIFAVNQLKIEDFLKEA